MSDRPKRTLLIAAGALLFVALIAGAAACSAGNDASSPETENSGPGSAATASDIDTPEPTSVSEDPSTLTPTPIPLGWDIDDYLENAILSENSGKYLKGDFAAAGYTILLPGSYDDRVEEYASVTYMEFNYSDGVLSEVSGGHTMAAVTLWEGDTGGYELVEYWEPRDGSDYDADLREKFPDSAYQQVVNAQQYALTETQTCYAKAIEHFGVDTATRLDALLGIICSAPADSSNPAAYIEAHPAEYREMLYYGDYTLQYAYSEFLAGGKTGLRDSVLLSVMRELLGDEDRTDITAGTAQEWFDEWKEASIRTMDENSLDYMVKRFQKTTIMLLMLDEAG